MIRHRILVLVIFLLSTLVRAQTIQFLESKHDFGRIRENGKVSWRFPVKNTGRLPLKITELRPSCGCTSAMLRHSILSPGESSVVDVNFDSAGSHGIVQKTVQVLSDDPKNPIVQLNIVAEIIQDVTIDPPIVSFINIPQKSHQGKSWKASVCFRPNVGTTTQIVKLIAPKVPYVHVSTRQDADIGVLDIRFDPSRIPRGTMRGMEVLSVLVRGDQTHTMNIPVQWQCQEMITATPPIIAACSEPGKDILTTIRLEHVYGRQFRILGVKSRKHCITVEMTRKSAAVHQLKIHIPRRSGTGIIHDQLVVTVDDPIQSELVVPVTIACRE